MTPADHAPGHSDELAESRARFEAVTGPLQAEPGVTRSTMMGLPCLRIRGGFFAAQDRTSGDLLVKLPEPRVQQLVSQGHAKPFAPAGRTFRQWAAVPATLNHRWPGLLREAFTFVGDHAG